MRLYVIRHGESETNTSGCWTGWADVPLTQKGREDALGIRPLLAEVRFDEVYSSDLCRARDTANIALPNAEIKELPLLREINIGSLSGKPFSSLTEEMKDRTDIEGFVEYGGESREEFSQRILEFINIVEHSESENVAVFSHGGWVLSLLNEMFGVTLPRDKVRCANCTVAVFERRQNGDWWLHSWINP